MVTQVYHRDPHQQVYLDYLAELERREREREERKRQEEAGGGPLGAGLGAGVGAIAGTLIAPGVGTAIGAELGRKAGGAIGTAVDPPGGPVGAARNQAWQQGIGAVTDLGVTAATWRDMQAPHEAPGTAPSFMETYAAQQGRGGLSGLYEERRRSERQMGLLQERDRARQQYLDGMRGIGYEAVPSGRAIQGRYDEIAAILKNEGNLSPSQQDQALAIAAQKPLDMAVRRVEPTPDDLWRKNTRFNQESGELYEYTMRNGSPSWGQLSDNAGNKLKEQKQTADEDADERKYVGDTQKRAADMLSGQEAEPTAWELEKKTRELMDMDRRIRSGEPQGPRPVTAGKTTVVPQPQQPKGMDWRDRAKIMASIPMGIMGGAGAQQAQQPGPQGQPAPPSPIEQTASQLMGMVEQLGGNVSKWPKAAREEGKVLAEQFQAELKAQFGDARNVPAELLPVLEIVAKLL